MESGSFFESLAHQESSNSSLDASPPTLRSRTSLSEICDHIQDGGPSWGVLSHSIAETTHSDTLPASSSSFPRSSPAQMSITPMASKGASTANLPVAAPPPQIPFAASPVPVSQGPPLYGSSSSMLPPVHPKRVRRTPSSKYDEDDHHLSAPRVSHNCRGSNVNTAYRSNSV